MKRQDKDTIRVVGYTRVSTAGQAEEGVSLAAQEERIRAYAQLYGLDLVAVVVDAGESARSLDRPGLQRVLGMLRRGEVAGLLVAKLDRLTRSVRDLGVLLEGDLRKRELFSVAEQIDTRSSGGRLVLNVLMSVAQWERETIGERTSAALRHKQRRGEYIGGVRPFGFRVEAGRIVEHEEERRAMMRAAELRAAGAPLRSIAATLHAEGLTDRLLAAESVRRILGSSTRVAA